MKGTSLTPLSTTAASQFGLVTTAQARDCGIGGHTLTRLVDRGCLVPMHHAVHRFVAAPCTWRQRVLGAVLTAGTGAAAARSTAAQLLDLRDRPRSATIAVVVAHDRRVRIDDPTIRVHRSRTLDADQVRVVDGIPVTDAARTVCDLAMERPVAALRELAAEALRRDLTTLAELDERLRRAGRISGARRLAAALRQLDPDTSRMRSRLEGRLLSLLEGSGLRRPAVAYQVVDDGRVRAELDLAYPDEKVAIEVDGYWWHSTPHQKSYDETRQNALVARGWRVLRFGELLLANHPQHVVLTVRAALEGAPPPPSPEPA